MSKKVKQISYLSAIIISVGSAMGAGIFFKNSEIFGNAGGHLGFMIAAWVIAAFGIMAIGLALVELSSGSKSDGGLLEWVKKFAPKRMAKYSSSYMLLIFLPLNYLALPIYSVMSLQDAIQSFVPDFHMSGWYVALIGFGFFLWFATLNYYKLKVAEKIQWVMTVIQFLPLLAAPIMAFIQQGQDGIVTQVGGATSGLTGFSPWLGLMASIPAILFAVDGFYTVTALRSNLHDEKKMGSIVAVAIAVIMASYLFFAISLGMAGGTDMNALKIVAQNKAVKLIFNVGIMMAVLGIVNGFGMSVVNTYHSMADEGHADWIVRFKEKFHIRDVRHSAFLLSILITVLLYVILVPIGIYAWKDQSYIDDQGIPLYGATAGNLFEMMDLITNFTSLFVFMFIGWAIAGGLHNRKTHKVEVKKSKYFLGAAWTAVIFLGIGVAYMFIAAFVDMFGVNGADVLTHVVKFIIMVGTALIALIPTWSKAEYAVGWAKVKSTFSKKVA